MSYTKTTERGELIRNDIMDFIVSYIEKHQYPPSIREIGKAVGLSSTSTVHMHIHRLIDEHRLETDITDTAISRAIRVPGYKFTKQ